MARHLRHFEYAEVVGYLSTIPAVNIAGAVALTGLTFVALTGYDLLSLRYAQARLSLRRASFAAVIGYSVSQAIGNPLLTGGATRYRLYSNWGLAPTTIGKSVLFAGVSFWFGFLTLGGLLFLVQPEGLPSRLDLPISAAFVGGLCLLLPLAYLGGSLWGGDTLSLWGWTFDVPPLWMLPVQVGLAAMDLLFASGVLYLLLPQEATVSFPLILTVYLVALLVGIISHVPGGLGVFDGIVLAVLTPTLDPESVLGALLAYRALFHLLPLALAGSAFLAYEIRQL